MLNGDGNDNGIKINRSNQQKNKLHLQHASFLNQQKKKQICTCSTLFCLSLPLFCTTTTLFCTTKTSNFLVSHYFYGGIVACVYPIFCFLCSCSLLFFTAARSLSRLLLLRDSSPLFSITRFSSSSVMHVSVNVKNNVEYKVPAIILPIHV